jgi:hypothetical protein
MTNEEYFRGLSDAEWDEAEAIADLGHVLCKGLTKDAELLFVRAALERKRANPTAAGVEMLNAGLVALGKPPLTSKRKPKRSGKLSEAL